MGSSLTKRTSVGVKVLEPSALGQLPKEPGHRGHKKGAQLQPHRDNLLDASNRSKLSKQGSSISLGVQARSSNLSVAKKDRKLSTLSVASRTSRTSVNSNRSRRSRAASAVSIVKALEYENDAKIKGIGKQKYQDKVRADAIEKMEKKSESCHCLKQQLRRMCATRRR